MALELSLTAATGEVAVALYANGAEERFAVKPAFSVGVIRPAPRASHVKWWGLRLDLTRVSGSAGHVNRPM